MVSPRSLRRTGELPYGCVCTHAIGGSLTLLDCRCSFGHMFEKRTSSRGAARAAIGAFVLLRAYLLCVCVAVWLCGCVAVWLCGWLGGWVCGNLTCAVCSTAERGYGFDVFDVHSQNSPVFIQWLEAVWQLLAQHPTRFEFNEVP